ncbi:MAG: CoA ester lyase [Burkholderiaceae bacterium]|nr:CoA ester lyase [Burkholderiaceae bacterium]
MTQAYPWRSLVFAPANRHELLAKFSRFAADNYVIDLEDGTPLDHKQSARDRLPQAVDAARAQGLRGRLLVRINAWDGPFGRDDLARALACPIDGIVLPKLESAAQLREIDALIDAAKRPCVIVGGIESLLGVMDVRACVNGSAHLRAVYFGAEDLATEMGIQRTAEGMELIYARQRVVLAAKAAGIAAIDQAVTQIQDDALFNRDGATGRAFGYEGKICLNPKQAGLANALFAPEPAVIAHATRLLEAVRAHQAQGHGVISFEGQMVDEPLIKRAERVLALARSLDAGGRP